MIAKILLSLSLLVIVFWIGWRAHLAWWLNRYGVWRTGPHGVVIPFDEQLWIDKLSGPILVLIVWAGFAVYCGARGWLS